MNTSMTHVLIIQLGVLLVTKDKLISLLIETDALVLHFYSWDWSLN